MRRVKGWAAAVRREAVTIYLVARDPRTPWYAKAVAALVVGYALSPIDLIPDFIPILGYLDDLLLLPGAIWIVIRLVPKDVLADCRARAEEVAQLPVSYNAALIIVGVWVTIALLAGLAIYSKATPSGPR